MILMINKKNCHQILLSRALDILSYYRSEANKQLNNQLKLDQQLLGCSSTIILKPKQGESKFK